MTKKKSFSIYEDYKKKNVQENQKLAFLYVKNLRAKIFKTNALQKKVSYSITDKKIFALMKSAIKDLKAHFLSSNFSFYSKNNQIFQFSFFY